MKFPAKRHLYAPLRHFLQSSITIVFLGLAVPALAQNQTASDSANQNSSFFHLLHPNKSEFELGALYEPSHKENDGPGEFDLNDYFLNIDLLSPESADTFLNFGVNYHFKSYSLKPVESLTKESSLDLHRIPFTLGYGTFLTEDFLVHGQGTIGAYTDLNGFPRTDDFQLHGKALAVYRINPFVQLVGGVLHSNDFDEQLLPLLGFRLQSGGGKLHLSITAPIDATVSYFLTPHTSFYLQGSVSGDEYRVAMGPIDTEFDLLQQDRRLGIGLTHWFNNNFNLSAELGSNINSTFEFKTLGAGQFREKTDDAYYGELRLGFAL